MPDMGTSARIRRSIEAAGLSRREMQRRTGISRGTLSRIVAGNRTAKMPEIASIAWAIGSTVAELTGLSGVRERAQFTEPATDVNPGMATMREHLLHYLELNAYLADQGIAG